MFKNQKLIILKNITSLGCGDSGGTVFSQIPLKREAQLEIPIVDGNSLKGTMKKQNLINENISVTDMKIILFPISTEGGVHYITCPFILKRLSEEIKSSDLSINKDFDTNYFEISFYDDEAITFNQKEDYRLIVDGVFFENKKSRYKDSIRDFMNSIGLKDISFSILSDKVFCFLINKHTSISIRNRIEEENTFLFDEEQFCPSTIFHSWCLSEKDFKINKKCFQLGSNKTLGRGIMQIIDVLYNTDIKN